MTTSDRWDGPTDDLADTPPARADILTPGPAPEPPPALIGNYHVKRFLGEGAMGEVYLAQDVTLGRRVALKLIKRGVTRGEGVSRFLEEARVTASFSHPHIVTIHAYGEHDGRPYLALEYLDGQSLRARLTEGPLPPREAARIGRAVAEALAEAHRHNVVHADLPPDNVLLPTDGRLRVVDFGLARFVGAATGSASGTPAYMAPERWRNVLPTGAIDVWSLGVILYELLTGRRPMTAEQIAQAARDDAPIAIPGMPADAPWASIVSACLAVDPAARPSAAEAAQRLANLVELGTADPLDARPPFPGLSPFARADAPYYVGRQAELDLLAERLRANPVVAVAGRSGVGKSSFVHAAVLPRLDGDARWTIVVLRPGADPFAALADALAGRRDRALAAALRERPLSLALTLAELARERASRVLVFVDQFEEIFTLAPAEASAFCECLAATASDDEPWRLVLTIRDDFVGRLGEAPHMRAHLGAMVWLDPLGPRDLAAAISTPLGRRGYAPDSERLIDRIVADVREQPACLPLLQFACRELWDRRDEATRTVLEREYHALGGAAGALARHAEQLVARLSTGQLRAAHSVLLALVHPDGTRRPRPRAELIDVGGDATSTHEVIEHLVAHRLVVTRRDLDTDDDDAVYEIAHEALVTAWPRLARWLEETHEQRALTSDIEEAARAWERRGKLDDDTWVSVRLNTVKRRLAQLGVVLTGRSRAFIDAGMRRQQKLRRRRRWIGAGSIGGLAAITVGAVAAAVAFAHKEQEALRQQAEIRLAAADMGRFDLELEPYDWGAAEQAAIAPAARPQLTWRLHAVDASDVRAPGRVYAGDDLRRGTPRWRGATLVERVEARSGPAFLEVMHRGGDCPPSWIFLQRLPGYTERAPSAVRAMHVRVPTCQASAAGAIAIPAGAFVRNGDREDGSTFDEIATLPAFAIDRTEVTRGAFSIYESMKAMTGDAAAPAAYLHLDGAGSERIPVVGVSFFTARSYCHYMGKELPTTDQWQKAFRGGLELGGGTNPEPARVVPWTTTAVAPAVRGANLAPETGHGSPAPVGSYPIDTSPYGVVDLAGNVSEWSLSQASTSALRGLRVLLGGAWDRPASNGLHLVTWRNARSDGYFDFETGIRCVTAPTGG
jgi:eukaryotic-like serine/threonine-protein kinase